MYNFLKARLYIPSHEHVHNLSITCQERVYWEAAI